MDVKTHEIHVGLQKGSQFLWTVCLNQQESGSTPGQVVPASNVLWIITIRIVLYNLAGGGAGFLLVETNSPQELTAFLQPYMDLMSFDVRAIYALDYQKQLQELRQVAQKAPVRK